MKHCHFTILYNEIDFLRLKMPFLYEHFDQLIFYDLLVFGNERKFSDDGSHEFIKNYPDPENKIALIEETDLTNIEPLGCSNIVKQKMFSYGSKFVHDDIDVFWCTDADEFFKEELIDEVESIFKRSVNSIGTKFYNFYKTPEFLLTYDKSLTVNPGENSSVRIVRHKPGNKYGHCDIGKNYKPISLACKNAIYHLSWVGEKRVKEKFSYYKDNPVTGFVSTKYIKEWEEFSEAKFNALNKRGFYGNPFVGPGRFERTQVTRCPFDIFEELPYLNKEYLQKMIFKSNESLKNIEQSIEEKPIKSIEQINNGVSIIVTAWKTEDYIEECLDSIENQTYFNNNDNFEVLIGIDGCQSTLNKLMQISSKYRNLKVIMMKKNMGTYITSNTLLTQSRFENILRVDSDDVLSLNMISEIMNHSENYDVIRYKIKNFGNYQLNNKENYAYGTIFFKKKLTLTFGAWQPWICHADKDFFNRLERHVKVKYIPTVLYYRRIHKNSLTRKLETCGESNIRKDYIKIIENTDYTKINYIQLMTGEYDEINVKKICFIYDIEGWAFYNMAVISRFHRI